MSMRKIIALCLILTQSFLFTSCGSDSKTVVVTFIATTGAGGGGIEELVYIDGQGNERGSDSNTNVFSFTQPITANDGDFVYLTACARFAGTGSSITVRILNNGNLARSASNTGTDAVAAEPDDPGPDGMLGTGDDIPGADGEPAKRPCVEVETFASVELGSGEAGEAPVAEGE